MVRPLFKNYKEQDKIKHIPEISYIDNWDYIDYFETNNKKNLFKIKMMKGLEFDIYLNSLHINTYGFGDFAYYKKTTFSRMLKDAIVRDLRVNTYVLDGINFPFFHIFNEDELDIDLYNQNYLFK